MSKENFTRYSMRENMLKNVLIRVDYDGVTDISKWVETFKQDTNLSSKFANYNIGHINKAKFDLSNNAEIARQRAMPIQIFESEPLHIFLDSRFPDRQDRVEMHIARLFLTFEIECKQYITIDDYFDYLEEYFKKFLEFDSFIKIRRIGIRKVGGDTFVGLDQMHQTFEPSYFDGHMIDDINTDFMERSFHDRFMKRIDIGNGSFRTVKVNYSTHCRRINGERPFQTILDIDGYVDDFIIVKDNLNYPQDLKATFECINNYLFELYKKSVTEHYLSLHGDQLQ